MLTTESVVLGDLENLAHWRSTCVRRRYTRPRQWSKGVPTVRESGPGCCYARRPVLGLMARSEEACEILLELNRALPHRPAILRRLVTVYEQLREEEKAEAFRRTSQRRNLLRCDHFCLR